MMHQLAETETETFTDSDSNNRAGLAYPLQNVPVNYFQFKILMNKAIILIAVLVLAE